MNNLNSILVEGNLVADPELSYGPDGMALCSFTVRVRRTTKNRDEKMVEHVITVPVLTASRLAETCAEYLKKGRGVRVVGRLDSLGGPVNAPLLSVHAEHVEFKPQLKQAASEQAEAAAL